MNDTVKRDLDYAIERIRNYKHNSLNYYIPDRDLIYYLDDLFCNENFLDMILKNPEDCIEMFNRIKGNINNSDIANLTKTIVEGGLVDSLLSRAEELNEEKLEEEKKKGIINKKNRQRNRRRNQ